MCGVFAEFAKVGTVDGQSVRAATRALRHRGPDAEGFYFHPERRVGLGHRRLSIVCPKDGQQPVSNELNSIWAVVNGEFYDDAEQRDQLECRGHQFRTRSDSEILVHLYEEHGVECLKFLQGEFAFVLWDETRQRLFAGRDRFGVKPLVYHETSRRFRVASEAKALFASGVQPEWDHRSFRHVANWQYLPPNRTLFSGVASVPPAHFLVATREGIRVHRYWQIEADQDPLPTTEPVKWPQLVEECREHLVNAVQCRLRSDVPVCTHLSGGLDSSAITGVVAATQSSPVDTFSVQFADARYDESAIATDTVKSLGANLHSVFVSSKDILDVLPEAVQASEGLAINGHLSAKYLLHKAMRQKGFSVALTGEGADEAFMGYRHLQLDWDRGGRDGDLSFRDGDRTSVGMMLPSGESLDHSEVNRQLGFVPTWVHAKATLGWKVHQLLKTDFRASIDCNDVFSESIQAVVGDSPNASHVRTSRKLWTRLATAGYILKTLGDGTEMPHSIEGRVPFLDHRLWRFLRAVPDAILFCGDIEKRLLRDAVRPYVTDLVFRRRKHPFDAPPVLNKQGTSHRDFLMDRLRSQEMRDQPFFCAGKVEDAVCRLPKHQNVASQTWDPIFMLVLSTLALQTLIDTPPASHSVFNESDS